MNSVETAINTVLQMANYINLYRVTDFDAFCDFSNFVESKSCEYLKNLSSSWFEFMPGSTGTACVSTSRSLMRLLLRGSSSKAANHRDVEPVRPELANRRDSLTNPHILAVWSGKIRSPANDQRMADEEPPLLCSATIMQRELSRTVGVIHLV